ncbi:M48 family metallopeptidase [Subsaximicrobium wynnwilliamsii]|uniref:M48 family metallopeptidase n=1 Tax=Subsaximicrobium wynnwilliamsii TaxID=291179 RepID=A0A5C6ZIF2_9FLAO|nr:SprT family zinc-dependent metalloprotease [Subsaximicrobium wynnwilliamsii]TXD83862.1 M48 family metallopeptidase [Subsaximicrobium wynnwilliamsii]TXD89603.1 M48 family metallopeptidase [Subsaximicrobium wynnwilliamsii]TXE02606.1 M48 family metallopeptidase [Subsaximicrobium wynnwilliamsii]
MPSVQYGHKTIQYSVLEKAELKSHYISVAKGEGVVLKGKAISDDHARKLILKKAKWIIDKLDLVSYIGDEAIVTGSRIQYLGRKYYVEIFVANDSDEVFIDFTESKFKVTLPKHLHNQTSIQQAFQDFLKVKAEEKITPRLRKWSKTTGLEFNALKFMQLEKRWGSCTPSNNIIINVEAIKLPFSLIDYLIVHELVHTKVKSHSKEFWAELSKHIPNWKELDERMYGMKL